jgi:Zn ribbon nucleic-acid-binding protein
MTESFGQIHERELFKKYELEITCPKCKGTDILIAMEDNGLFFVSLCNKCGYKK